MKNISDSLKDYKFCTCFKHPKKYAYFLKVQNNKGDVKLLDIDINDIVKYYIKDDTADNADYYDFYTKEPIVEVKPERANGKILDKYKIYDSISPIYKIIRRYVWNRMKYREPKLFILDIETRSGDFVPDILKVNYPVTSIQIYNNYNNTTTIFGSKKFNNTYNLQDEELNDTINYIYCKSERDIFNKFFDLIENEKPDIVIAHYGELFDYPYLYNRAKKLSIPNRFSPYGISELREFINSQGRTGYSIQGPGIAYMDSIDIYKKFIIQPRKSYSLEYLGELHTNTGKTRYKQFFKSIDDFYMGKIKINEKLLTNEDKKDPLYKAYLDNNQDKIEKISYDLFIKYAARDVQLLFKILDKTGLIKLMTSIAEKMGILYKDVLGTTKPWSIYLSNIAFENNLIIPKSDSHNITDTYYEGGYVKDPIKGKSEWLFSLDINSMYPNIIIGYNMSPETIINHSDLPDDLKELVENYFMTEDENSVLNLDNSIKEQYYNLLKKYNYVGTLSGAIFDKSKQGLLPKLVQDIYTNRAQIKTKMKELKKLKDELKHNKNAKLKYSINELEKMIDDLNLEQGTLKILINSVYGALGNKYFLLYNKEIAKAVTAQGRFFIKYMSLRGASIISSYIKKLSNKIINPESIWVYTDTDSVYFTIAILLKELRKKYNKKDSLEVNLKMADSISSKLENIIISSSVSDLDTFFNLFDKSAIAAKREIIADVGIFVAKKNYILSVRDDEGIKHLDNAYLKFTGIELAKSSIAPYSEKVLSEGLKYLLYGNINDLKKYIKDVKKDFIKANPDEISKTISVQSLDYEFDFNKRKFVGGLDKNGNRLGAPINSASSLIHNIIIKDKKLNYDLIQPGDKVKLLYMKNLKYPLNNVLYDIKSIAFLDENFIIDNLKQHIDYDMNWSKYVIKPLQNIADSIGWDLTSKPTASLF